MKIVFYAADAAKAKAYVTDLRLKKQAVRLFQADAVHEAIPCDEIEFMPDMSEWDRDRLNALYGKEPEAKTDAPAGGNDDPGPKFKIGKGPGGRIYIFDVEDGRKIHSGPFETDALAEEAMKVILAK